MMLSDFVYLGESVPSSRVWHAPQSYPNLMNLYYPQLSLLRLYKKCLLYYDAFMFTCKLICSDIDGTLVTPSHTITQRTREAIKKARRKGIIVALVSGRLSHSLRLIQEDLGIDGPLGCFNGSLVLDDEYNELEAHPIDQEKCTEILQFLSTTELEHFVFTNESWYMRKRNSWYDVEVATSHIEGRIHPLLQLSEILHENERPFKVLAMHQDPQYIQKMSKKIEAHFTQRLNIFNSSPRYIEILARGVDKGHAVRSLCNTYAIDASEVMAVGDYYNDIGMFRAAGYAVAMENAPDLVKEHAHFITKSNTEDGLALAIESVL